MKKFCLFFVNIIFLLLLGFALFMLNTYGKPMIQDFTCDDESIKKPLVEQTVSVPVLLAAIGSLAIICFITVEFIKVAQTYRFCENVSAQLKRVVCNVFFCCVMFSYGITVTVLMTNLGKYTIGRLRPNFIATCQPDWSRINCTDKSGFPIFVSGDDYCTKSNEKELKEARLSFPSGHTSFAAFAATFLITYMELEITCQSKWGVIPKLFFQIVLALGAFYCGLTRISDFKHHPTDVVGGFSIGICVALFFQYSIKKNNKNEMDEIV